MRRFRRSIQRSTTRRARLLGTTMGLGLGLTLAAAGVGAQEKKDEVALPPLDVSGQRGSYQTLEPSLFKLGDLLKNIPQSITVLPSELLRQQSSFTLREALRTVSGISLNAGEGGVQGDNLTLRGFSARNDIFVDGVRDLGAYTRDSFNLEQVEVLKGPSSVLFGRGSTGGVVNLVTKTPQRTPSYSFSPSVGTGPLFRGTADLNHPLSSEAAVRLNVMGHTQETVGRDEVKATRVGVAPSIALGLGTPTVITFSGLYQHEDNVPDDGHPYLFGRPAPIDRELWFGLAEKDYERTDAYIGTLRLDHTVNDHVKLQTTIRYALALRDHQITAPRIVGGPLLTTPIQDIMVSRGRPSRTREDSILSGQTDVIVTFDTWLLKHKVITGVEVSRETGDSTTFTITGAPSAFLVNPDPHVDAALRRVRNQIITSESIGLGAFVLDEITITDQWKVIGGVRYDRFKTDFRQEAVATGLKLEFDRADWAFSPRAALIFQPTPAQTFYFSYGTSFNPSAEALVLAANNANVKPEESRTFELGAKIELMNKALALRGAIFRTEKTNARTIDPVEGTTTLDGKQRVDGFELEAIGRVLPGWNVFFGYSYLDGRVLEAADVAGGVAVEGKMLPNVPEHSIGLWTTYDITERWQIGGGLNFMTFRTANTTGTNEVPGHVVADVTAAFRPTKSTEVRMTILNLNDARYYSQVYQAHVVPGASRTFILSGGFSF